MIPPLKDAQSQQLVVTLLGSYVRDRSRLVWSGGLVRVLDLFGATAPAARIALARMVRRGLLSPHKEGRTVHYALTERMQVAIRRGDERIFRLGQLPGADEPWTFLWHMIPEQARHERALLGRRLRFAGFGSPQDGLWLSPADRTAVASELVSELHVQDVCSIFLGTPNPDTGTETLIDSAWDRVQLADAYQAFTDEFAPFKTAAARRKLSDVDALRVHVALAERFRAFAALDPGLPPHFAKRPASKRKAVALFDLLYEELMQPADEAFERLVAPPAASEGRRRAGRQS